MANKNLKIEKKKEYNPFVTRTIKRETVGKVKCYLKAVKQNQKDAFGVKKNTVCTIHHKWLQMLLSEWRNIQPRRGILLRGRRE